MATIRAVNGVNNELAHINLYYSTSFFGKWTVHNDGPTAKGKNHCNIQ